MELYHKRQHCLKEDKLTQISPTKITDFESVCLHLAEEPEKTPVHQLTAEDAT